MPALERSRSSGLFEVVREAGGVMTSRQPLDSADREAVRDWVDEAVAEHGGIDILYNNASAPRFAPVAEMAPEDWHATIRKRV